MGRGRSEGKREGAYQIPPRGLAGVAQLVVGSEDDEDLGGVRHFGCVEGRWMDDKCEKCVLVC
jgi:hypothetical protein